MSQVGLAPVARPARTRRLSPRVDLARRVWPEAGLPPDDDPAWTPARAWLREVAWTALRLYVVALFLAVVLGWPTDLVLLQGDPVVRGQMTTWRLGTVALMAAWVLVGTRLVDPRRQVALWSAAYAGSLTLWTAWAVGRSGGFDSPWPYYLYFALTSLLPVPSWSVDRGAVLAAIAAAIATGFLVLHPEHRADPRVPDAMMFLVTVTGLTMVLGEVVLVAALAFFFQRRRLEAVSASLSDLNRDLDERLRARTADLRALARHLVDAQEHERNRIAGELHDELRQQLAAIRFVIRAWKRSEDRPAEVLADVDALVATASESVRRLAHSLRPLALEQVGLTAACASLVGTMCAPAGLAHDLTTEGDLDGLDPEVGVTVYRVLHEALTNITRHAKAHSVDVVLSRGPEGVCLTVQDDGVGLGDATPGHGLVGMRERARSAGGRLTLGAVDGGGTEVRLDLPAGGVST